MYYTYILQSSKTGRYYIGSTSNIDARLKRHNSGTNKSTKYGIPWVLLYKEEFIDYHDAYRREMEIKRYKGGNAFKRLIQ